MLSIYLIFFAFVVINSQQFKINILNEVDHKIHHKTKESRSKKSFTEIHESVQYTL
ncbi:hypothetical protein CYPRO_1714 [Cyclonatronum proteinivorum]|uniref:Uncharacterized protein n=1 Tax=Cyclonatronum proteinivorum TaxID=1457365 RepID=A0A345UKG3_9BACT|nr:hypothetical protein CYPRO_1714 [Cyclonatronum proteinivorum]